MAHLINFNEQKGTHSFVSHGEKAWHGLGQVVDTAMTSAQCIELANLDYEVQIQPNFTRVISEEGTEQYIEKPNEFSTVRMDTKVPLGTVKGRYEVVQNKDAFGFFDAIIDSGEAIFETAGALGEGERIFVTAKLPEDLLVGGEPCNKYILLTNSHDGTSSILAGFTSIRVVCNNTLQAAMKGLNNKVMIEHRIGAKDRLSEAYKLMNIGSKYMDEVGEIFNQMAKTKMEDNTLKSYIEGVMKSDYIAPKFDEEQNEIISTRLKNQVNAIYEFALSHPTQTTDAARGTVWGAYNSISGYYNYLHKYKSEEQKFSSQMFGNANNKILKAFSKAIELV
jgi:phage/plasmid-like protein (TIGR03299 family)